MGCLLVPKGKHAYIWSRAGYDLDRLDWGWCGEREKENVDESRSAAQDLEDPAETTRASSEHHDDLWPMAHWAIGSGNCDGLWPRANERWFIALLTLKVSDWSQCICLQFNTLFQGNSSEKMMWVVKRGNGDKVVEVVAKFWAKLARGLSNARLGGPWGEGRPKIIRLKKCTNEYWGSQARPNNH